MTMKRIEVIAVEPLAEYVAAEESTETNVPATTAVKEAITRISTARAKMMNSFLDLGPMESSIISPMEPPL